MDKSISLAKKLIADDATGIAFLDKRTRTPKPSGRKKTDSFDAAIANGIQRLQPKRSRK